MAIRTVTVDEAQACSGGFLFLALALTLWANANNGGAYESDRGAGAWG